MKKLIKEQKGQTLVILLIYMIIAMIITSAAIIMVMVNAQATDKVYEGSASLDVAESGAENAIMKLIRNPSYVGETLTVNGGTATINITGTNPKTIVSKGVMNNFTKTVEATVDVTGGIVTVTSWKEK